MKAITYTNYGSASVLELKDREKPEPKADEVLIRVHAVEVTKSDIEMRSFKFPVKWFWLPLRCAFGIRKPRRQILGGYFSGEVESLGTSVTQFSIGDEVFGACELRLGAYAEFVALPASYAIVAKPVNMSFVEAAAVPLGGLNALHFMRLANIQTGDQVLINGAGGSIGLHSVQIAKAMGAEVTVVDSVSKKPMLMKVGADTFIDYNKEDFTTLKRTYDVIFDMVVGNSYASCINILKPNGRYLSGNPSLSVMVRSIITTLFTNKSARFAMAGETPAELLEIKEMVEAGVIKSIVDKVYPMEQIVEAHRRVETEARLGAVVVAIDQRNTVLP